MRFEIGPGGGFIILVGLLGLSAAVFFLGMISGREMAQSEQSQNQLAAVYPMPAGAPAASPPQGATRAASLSAAPIAAATPKPAPRAAVASDSVPPAAVPKPPPAHRAPPRPTLASVPPPHPSAPAAEEPDADSSASSNEGTGAEEGTASAPPPRAGTHHHGYNIVIDAAMDRAAASRMASRLLQLGYTSHIVPSQINGETWYRVQVGPYPTSDDARAAQAQLRAAYTARYINRAGAANTRPTNTDTSDNGAADSGSNDSGRDSAPSD
ncbi:MAG: SPOR domain-containing protein [Candidatus Binataceae bacterium]